MEYLGSERAFNEFRQAGIADQLTFSAQVIPRSRSGLGTDWVVVGIGIMEDTNNYWAAQAHMKQFCDSQMVVS